MWERPSFTSLRESLSDPSNPIGMRMRAAYYLRQLYVDLTKGNTTNDGTTCACDVVSDNRHHHHNRNKSSVIDTLCMGLNDARHGSLMRHEFAYVLGQLRDEQSCETLETLLRDDHDCVMVRHECAEALGAIGADRSLPILRQVMEDNIHVPELSETCQLAINVMEWRRSGNTTRGLCVYVESIFHHGPRTTTSISCHDTIARIGKHITGFRQTHV